MSTKTKESAAAKSAPGKARRAARSNGAAKHKKRLRPGELGWARSLLHAQARRGATVDDERDRQRVEKSSGAVANCLARLARAKRSGWRKKLPARMTSKGSLRGEGVGE